jgi:hypothetical protein
VSKPSTLRRSRRAVRRALNLQAKEERKVRATCCNWDVPESQIVLCYEQGGETYRLCSDCDNKF